MLVWLMTTDERVLPRKSLGSSSRPTNLAQQAERGQRVLREQPCQGVWPQEAEQRRPEQDAADDFGDDQRLADAPHEEGDDARHQDDGGHLQQQVDEGVEFESGHRGPGWRIASGFIHESTADDHTGAAASSSGCP
jgi:hypothetical protein